MRNWAVASLIGLLLLVGSSPTLAGVIVEADLDPSATLYEFAGESVGTTTVSSGILTVNNGAVSSITIGNLVSPAYYDGGDSSVIEFLFSSAVTQVGLDWYANNADPTLSVYDSSNTLLGSVTLDYTLFPTDGGYPYGFIGFEVPGGGIVRATIDTPLSGNELYVDNIRHSFVASAVPEPSSFLLLGLGLGGLFLAVRRSSRARAGR